MAKRRELSTEFKAKVALAAPSGEMTLAELAAKYDVHPTVIATWKRQAKEDMVAGFFGQAAGKQKDSEAEIKELHAKVGRLTMENDFLQQVYARKRAESKGGEWSTATVPGLASRASAICWGCGARRITIAPKGEREGNLRLMRLIDEVFLEAPFFGTRPRTRHLANLGHSVGRRRIKRLMREMGVMAVYQKPRTSQPHPVHRVYPYLLRLVPVTRPNQVWCADITDILMRRGFYNWWTSWIGTAAQYCPGGSPTPWTPISA